MFDHARVWDRLNKNYLAQSVRRGSDFEKLAGLEAVLIGTRKSDLVGSSPKSANWGKLLPIWIVLCGSEPLSAFIADTSISPMRGAWASNP
jgi:hypothetical protein